MVADGFIKMRTDETVSEGGKGIIGTPRQIKMDAAKQSLEQFTKENQSIAATTIKQNRLSATKTSPRKSQFGMFLKSIPRPGSRKTKPLLGVRDQVKVMRLRSMLEKQKLNNLLEKYKLQVKVEQLRRKGKLPMMVNRPTFLMPRRPFNIFENPTINADIDSGFNADMHTNENLFGQESFFGGEKFFDEDYFGNEFDTDPFFHLQIKPQRGLSPLWW